MAALCAAPWYFQAAFCLFGGLLIVSVFVLLVGWVCDNWPGDVDDPSIYCADDSRDPSKE